MGNLFATSSSYFASLVRPVDEYVPSFVMKWDSDFREALYRHTQGEKVLNFAQKSSIATRVQETSYNILTRW